MNGSHWHSGDTILLRGTGFGKLWFAMPANLVQDNDDLIAFYWPCGTRWMDVYRRPLPAEIAEGEPLPLIEMSWTRTHVLVLVRPGAAHSIYVMWDAASLKVDCWYINLQSPLCRTPLGFDTMDHVLDIVVSPDRSEWHWKDEDEFCEAITAGAWTHAEAQQIRREGARALKLLQAGDGPYSPDWANWRPPREWCVPELPARWDGLMELEK